MGLYFFYDFIFNCNRKLKLEIQTFILCKTFTELLQAPSVLDNLIQCVCCWIVGDCYIFSIPCNIYYLLEGISCHKCNAFVKDIWLKQCPRKASIERQKNKGIKMRLGFYRCPLIEQLRKCFNSLKRLVKCKKRDWTRDMPKFILHVQTILN